MIIQITVTQSAPFGWNAVNSNGFYLSIFLSETSTYSSRHTLISITSCQGNTDLFRFFPLTLFIRRHYPKECEKRKKKTIEKDSVFDAVISISHSHHRLRCYYFHQKTITNRARGPTPIWRYHATLFLCRYVDKHTLVQIVCEGIGWLGLRSFMCRVWEELQFNNSHERSHGKSAKHLSPQAICQMIYERRQNETGQKKTTKFAAFFLLSIGFHLQLFVVSVSVAFLYSLEIGCSPISFVTR